MQAFKVMKKHLKMDQKYFQTSTQNTWPFFDQMFWKITLLGLSVLMKPAKI